MVAVMCMLWVANMALACSDFNEAWACNALGACVLTVCLVGVLV